MIAGVYGCDIALAQNNDVGSTRVSDQWLGSKIHEGWVGYVGASAGYTNTSNESSFDGAPTSLKVLASYVTPDLTGVFDFGLGFHNETLSRHETDDSFNSIGVMELSSRYQFINRWQLGGVYNQYFNLGFNYTANQADLQFLGVQVLREFNFAGSYLGRVGGRLMTSLNINNESVNMAIFDFQVGWSDTNHGF